MSTDILRQTRKTNPNVKTQFSGESFNESFILLEDRCISINNKNLCQIELPVQTRDRNNVYTRDLDINENIILINCGFWSMHRNNC